MKSKGFGSQIMVRVRDVKLLDRLNELYLESKFESVNEFMNILLAKVAFKEMKEDEILKVLENVEDKVNASHSMIDYMFLDYMKKD